MKKLFALVAVLAMVASASANVLWEEKFGELATQKNINGKDYWPYAGGDAEKNYVYTDYSNEYDEVKSYGVSVRTKGVGSDATTKYNGFYFSKDKEAGKNYVELIKANMVEGQEMYLVFDFLTDQAETVSTDKFIVKVNGEAVTVPSAKTNGKYAATTVGVKLPAGAINSLYFAQDNGPVQLFMLNIKITDEMPEAIENVFASKKVTKTIEDGQIVMIIDGVRYNAMGAKL